MATITSPQNPAVKHVRSLSEKKHRQATGLFIAEGPHMLARARETGWPIDTLIVSGEPPEGFEAAKILRVSDKVMASLSAQANPPEMIGVFHQRIGDKLPLPGHGDVWVALDTIRDPGNLGTIIRTIDAAGAAGVALIGESCDPWSPECVRATVGSIFAVPLVKMSEAEFEHDAAGWPGEVVSTRIESKNDYRRRYRPPILLLMGSEGRGLSPSLARLAGTDVRIPMAGGAQSLNVAIATALMLYEVRRADLGQMDGERLPGARSNPY